jgi:hypothetical protein
VSAGVVDGTDVHVPIRLRGVDVIAEVTVDAREVSRRAGLGAADQRLGGPDVLAELLQIPTDAALPAAWLGRRVRGLLESAQWHVVQPQAGLVRRVTVPAARVDQVSVPTTRWRTGLRQAGRFAPYCARRLLLQSLPRDVSTLVLEATYWGVGVAVADDAGGWRELVVPAPFVAARYTGASWAFAEQAYVQAVRSGAGGLSAWSPATGAQTPEASPLG